MRRGLCHDRELAQRQGTAVAARAGLLALHGRHLLGSRGGTAPDHLDRGQRGSTIQCNRRPVRRGARHGEHDPGRAAAHGRHREAALWPAGARGTGCGHRLRGERARQQRVLRARSGVDAGRWH
jgi:hypothetical protein